MSSYLLVIGFIGLWNLLSFVWHKVNKEPSMQYIYHILVGVFAFYFLFTLDESCL